MRRVSNVDLMLAVTILLWALRTHRRNRERFTIQCEFLGKGKKIVRLQTAREVERFMAAA